MFELIRDAIAAHQTIILHRHTNPDGDALGSQIGLKHLILANYPDKTVHMVGDGAGRYGFMADSIMDEIPDSAYQGALAIVLDTSAKSLISDTRYTLAAPPALTITSSWRKLRTLKQRTTRSRAAAVWWRRWRRNAAGR